MARPDGSRAWLCEQALGVNGAVEAKKGLGERLGGLRGQEQWTQTQIPYIESLVESGRYPLLTRVVPNARAPRGLGRLKPGFDLALERVLDGLAAVLPNS